MIITSIKGRDLGRIKTDDGKVIAIYGKAIELQKENIIMNDLRGIQRRMWLVIYENGDCKEFFTKDEIREHFR